MEKRRSPLVSIPPFGRGFSRHRGSFESDVGWAAQERVLTPPFIVLMSPPGYPSAWLRPRSARFRFARDSAGTQTGQTRIVSCDRWFRQLSMLFGVCQSTSCTRQALAVH